LSLALPLLVAYWKRFSLATRCFGLIVILLNIAVYVSSGTNKILVDTLLITFSVISAGYLGGWIRLGKRGLLGIGAGAIVLFAAAFLFFSNGMNTRPDSPAANGYIPGADAMAKDDVISEALPASLRVGYLGLTSYLSHGYYGLALALELPFEPMYGLGN